jgi:predicted PurR-regulated permease PerM
MLAARPGYSRFAITVLAVLAGIAALYAAQAFVVPLLIGVLASYTLAPLVEGLAVRRVPRSLAAALVVTLLGGSIIGIGYALSDDVATMAEKLPEAARKLRERVSDGSAKSTPLHNVQEAARELEKAAASAAGEKVIARPAASAPPPDTMRNYVLTQSAVLIGAAVQALFVLLLVFFLLASGHDFKRRVVRIFGRSADDRQRVVGLLQAIEFQVQRYMLAMLISNILIAACTWIAFEMLGVENAGVWGVAAGVLHFIPYLGPTVTAIASLVASVVQFDAVLPAIAVSATSVIISAGIGMIFMTWLHSRFASVNAAMLFIALLFFGWMWGVWGLLLGAPLIAITKVVCDHIDYLKPVGALLGR